MKRMHFVWGWVGLVSFLVLSGCISKSPSETKIEALKTKAAQYSQEMVKLEGELKNAGSDEGKQNFLRHDIELLKSRVLRLKEEAKELNGGKEVPFDSAPSEGGGGHH